MIISLTGFMGCGKSSVGRKLSELLCCPFMDLDDVIVESAGRSIPEIFESEGEPAFRQMELEALKTVAGGGMSKTKSLPRLRRDAFPFTRPRAATVFDTPATYNENCTTVERKCQFRTSVSSTEDEKHHCKKFDDTCTSQTLVLALGGGAVMTKECAEIVREQTCCIYLKASIETLMGHLAGEADGRPMLANASSAETSTSAAEPRTSLQVADTSLRGADTSLQVADTSLRGADTSLRGAERRGNPLYDRITELMAQRSETYEKTAHIIVDTDGKSIEEIAQKILESIR